MSEEQLMTEERQAREIQQLHAQVAALQAMLAMQPASEPEEPEGYLVIRSNIGGYTTIIHPDLRYRGKRGDVSVPPYSEVVVPASWRDSPNLAVSVQKGVVSVREVDEPPEKLVTIPDWPEDEAVVIEPLHKAIAIDIAKNGADSDEGDITSYPKTVQLLLLTDLRRGEGRGGVDIGYMQDVVMPVFERALAFEQAWRNRKWVVDLLEERITAILNLTSRRR